MKERVAQSSHRESFGSLLFNHQLFIVDVFVAFFDVVVLMLTFIERTLRRTRVNIEMQPHVREHVVRSVVSTKPAPVKSNILLGHLRFPKLPLPSPRHLLPLPSPRHFALNSFCDLCSFSVLSG